MLARQLGKEIVGGLVEGGYFGDTIGSTPSDDLDAAVTRQLLRVLREMGLRQAHGQEKHARMVRRPSGVLEAVPQAQLDLCGIVDHLLQYVRVVTAGVLPIGVPERRLAFLRLSEVTGTALLDGLGQAAEA